MKRLLKCLIKIILFLIIFLLNLLISLFIFLHKMFVAILKFITGMIGLGLLLSLMQKDFIVTAKALFLLMVFNPYVLPSIGEFIIDFLERVCEKIILYGVKL